MEQLWLNETKKRSVISFFVVENFNYPNSTDDLGYDKDDAHPIRDHFS